MEEQVLVIPNYTIKNLITEENDIGFYKITDDKFDSIIESKSFFMNRSEAENDFNHRQVIPYICVKYDQEYLLYKRLSGSGENRLHDKYSLGIGGHVNPVDSKDNLYCYQLSSLYNCIYREIEEELCIQTTDHISSFPLKNTEYKNPVKIGYLISNFSDVDRVHLGVVYEVILNVNPNYVKSGESDSLQIDGWYDIVRLKSNLESVNFEKWTDILIRSL